MTSRGRHLSRLLLSGLLPFLAACGEDSPAPPVDSDPPVISAVSPAPWTRVTGTTPLAITAAGARHYSYAIDNAPPVESDTSPVSWNSADVLNGPHNVKLVATNGAGPVDTTIILVADNPGRGTAVLVAPREVEVEPDGEFQFEAIILGGAGGGVSWHLVQPGTEPGAWGTLSEDGRYTAPNGLPIPPTATVVARSLADPGKASSARILIRGIALRIVGAPETLYPGQWVQLQTLVQGSDNTSVVYTLEGGAAWGAVTTEGRYTAPEVVPDPPFARIRATSVADPGRSALVGIRILPRPLPVAVSLRPNQVALRPNQSTSFTASVLNATDTRVAWTVEGGSTFGTINGTGLYQAPSLVPNPPVAVIRATSFQDPTASATAEIQLRPPILLSISPSSGSLFRYEAITFSATLTNADDPRVTWGVRGAAPLGSITTDGVYTAPAIVPPARDITVVAQSIEDPTVFGTVTVRLNPDSELEVVGRLANAGYELAQIGDQAVDAATSVLALAQLLNGGQVTTTGRITGNGTSFQYEAVPGATTLEVVEPAKTTTLTVTDFSGIPHREVGGWEVSGSRFIGTLMARYQVGSTVDLRITHSSEDQQHGVIAFQRFVRGTIRAQGYESVGFSDHGTASLGFHAADVQHDLVGEYDRADGSSGRIDEEIVLGSGEGCAFPPYTVGSSWSHRFRNALTADGVTLASDGWIEGSGEWGCGGGLRSVDRWNAQGAVTRNGEPWGELAAETPVPGQAALPDVRLHIDGVGAVRFRRSGLPSILSFVPHP